MGRNPKKPFPDVSQRAQKEVEEAERRRRKAEQEAMLRLLKGEAVRVIRNNGVVKLFLQIFGMKGEGGERIKDRGYFK